MAKDLTYTAGSSFLRLGRAPSASRAIFSAAQAGSPPCAPRATSRRSSRYINEHGGVLTDSVEREIAKRFIDPAPGRF